MEPLGQHKQGPETQVTHPTPAPCPFCEATGERDGDVVWVEHKTKCPLLGGPLACFTDDEAIAEYNHRPTIHAARLAQLEQDCAAVCPGCRRGESTETDDMGTLRHNTPKSLRPHPLSPGQACKAHALRARFEAGE